MRGKPNVPQNVCARTERITPDGVVLVNFLHPRPSAAQIEAAPIQTPPPKPRPPNPGEDEESLAMPMLAMGLRARPLRPVYTRATLALRLGRPAPARPPKELVFPVLPS